MTLTHGRQAPEAAVRLVCQADNAEGFETKSDGRQWSDQQPLTGKVADTVVGQEGVLRSMHLRKKGVQGRDIGLTLQTSHRGLLVARRPLLPHRGGNHDKKREPPLREDRRGEGDVVEGRIPHQLVLGVLQPVHQFGVAGCPIVRGHCVSFRCDLGIAHRTRSAGRLASARRGALGAGAGCAR